MRNHDELLARLDKKHVSIPASHTIYSDAATAIRELRAAVLDEGGAREPVAWQRRIKFSDVPGAIPKWEQCGQEEATSHFDHSPYHEYRALYAAPIAPPPAGKELPFRDLIIGNMEYRITFLPNNEATVVVKSAVPADGATVPEGCTPADAQMLRKANHALAIESDTRAKLLIEWLETELDASDEEYEPWVKSFTERAKAVTASYWDGATRSADVMPYPEGEQLNSKPGTLWWDGGTTNHFNFDGAGRIQVDIDRLIKSEGFKKQVAACNELATTQNAAGQPDLGSSSEPLVTKATSLDTHERSVLNREDAVGSVTACRDEPASPLAPERTVAGQEESTMTEWLVIESSMTHGVFTSDIERQRRGFIPREIAEKLIGRKVREVEWFTAEESKLMHAAPEWRDTLESLPSTTIAAAPASPLLPGLERAAAPPAGQENIDRTYATESQLVEHHVAMQRMFPHNEKTVCGGCKQEIFPGEIYRCYDCAEPFHRLCCKKHHSKIDASVSLAVNTYSTKGWQYCQDEDCPHRYVPHSHTNTAPMLDNLARKAELAPVSPALPGLEPIAWMYDVCNDGLNAFTQSKREVSMWPDKSKVVPVYTAAAIRAEISRLKGERSGS